MCMYKNHASLLNIRFQNRFAKQLHGNIMDWGMNENRRIEKNGQKQ